jgi:preprotein translocase subunit SecF
MRGFRLVPDDTRIPFVRYQYWAYAFTGVIFLMTLVLLPTKGLNLGIDFRGGILIEAGMPGEVADLAAMRATLGSLGLGEVALQEFGQPDDILIRIERQEGGEAGQRAAVDKAKGALGERFGDGISYRRVEFVGPKVSADLMWSGIQASVYAMLAIMAYLWFRFEWQYSVGAMLATFHDAFTTLGLFSLFGLEFNLTTVAAVLTIIGYSVNDTARTRSGRSSFRARATFCPHARSRRRSSRRYKTSTWGQTIGSRSAGRPRIPPKRTPNLPRACRLR